MGSSDALHCSWAVWGRSTPTPGPTALLRPHQGRRESLWTQGHGTALLASKQWPRGQGILLGPMGQPACRGEGASSHMSVPKVPATEALMSLGKDCCFLRSSPDTTTEEL